MGNGGMENRGKEREGGILCDPLRFLIGLMGHLSYAHYLSWS